MAGTLTISTLSDGTNSTSATNCIKGAGLAWCNFAGSSGSISGSYNVSSVTRNGTGDYTVNFTNAMPNINYSLVGTCTANSAITDIPSAVVVLNYSQAPTTTTRRFWTGDSRNANKNDMNMVNIMVMGN